MRKILLFLVPLLLATASFAAQPGFRIPKDVDNVKDTEGAFSGVSRVWLSSVTNARLVLDSDDVQITDGYIHWIVMQSTEANSTAQWLELRSTGTANITSQRLLPRLYVCEQSADDNCNPVLTFRPPIPFSNGLSANVGVPVGGAIQEVTEFAIGVSWKKK